MIVLLMLNDDLDELGNCRGKQLVLTDDIVNAWRGIFNIALLSMANNFRRQ